MLTDECLIRSFAARQGHHSAGGAGADVHQRVRGVQEDDGLLLHEGATGAHGKAGGDPGQIGARRGSVCVYWGVRRGG